MESDSIGWLDLPEPAVPGSPSLILIGDSTVRNGGGDGDGGQWGWGDSLGEFFDSAKVNVVNRAIGGLSSRTFLTQGHWERALSLIKPGDFVIIQFGHNDSSPLNDNLRARGTIRGIGEESEEIDNLLTKRHETVHSYGWYLRKYVREIKAAGAIPILCSPVPRKIWENNAIVRANESYGGWARAVAASEGVGFIDLNELVARRYDSIGEVRTEPMFADKNTHTTKAGANLSAEVLVGGIRALPGAPIDALLSKRGENLPPAS